METKTVYMVNEHGNGGTSFTIPSKLKRWQHISRMLSLGYRICSSEELAAVLTRTIEDNMNGELESSTTQELHLDVAEYEAELAQFHAYVYASLDGYDIEITNEGVICLDIIHTKTMEAAKAIVSRELRLLMGKDIV